MNRAILLLLISFVTTGITTFAQNIPVRQLPTEVFRTINKAADTSHWTWKRGGVFNFNMAQGSQKNWAAGGDNFSIALNSYVNYFLYYQHKNQTWDNNVDYNLGFVQTTSIGARKNDDRLDYLSKFGLRVDTTNKLYISSLFNLRTQFFNGYSYSGSTKSLASALLSPGYILLSVGMDYKPVKSFSMFLSPITNRTTMVANNTLSKQGVYGVDSNKHILNEFGAFASLNYAHPITKNITYKGRLDLFSDYANRPQNVDMYMTNYFTFKINRYLSATYTLNFIYDDNVRLFGPNGTSPGLQVQSQLGIGFSVPFSVKKHV